MYCRVDFGTKESLPCDTYVYMALCDVVKIYNKYLLLLLTSLKDVDHAARDNVRLVLKLAGVLAIDHESSKYITVNDGKILTDDCLILPDVRLESLIAGVAGGHKVAQKFLPLLDVLSATYHARDNVLATQSLRAIIAVQSGSSDASDQVSAIFDDEVNARLLAYAAVVLSDAPPPVNLPASTATTETTESTESTSTGNAFMDALAGSSIATVAKEIADDLVDSDLLKDVGTDPSKIDFASLLDPSSKLGGVAKLVSSKLHAQLGSGKLDQGKLMTEVMSMFGKLNTTNAAAADNPLLSQVMNMAGQMGAAHNRPPRTQKSAKLQTKLSKR